MSIRVINLSETVEYQSESDSEKGTDNATVFVLGALPSRIRAMLQDKGMRFVPDDGANGEVGMRTDLLANQVGLDKVRYGCREIRNLEGAASIKDADGNIIPCNQVNTSLHGQIVKALPNEIIDLLPITVIRELAMKIDDLSSITEEDKKN